MCLEERQKKLLNTPLNFLTENKLKELFRIGIPDSQKRRILLERFNVNTNTCDFDYQAIKNSVD